MKTTYIVLFSSLIFLSVCCQKDESNKLFFNKYKEIYGSWKPVSIKGGKSGFEISPDFQILKIEKENIFEVISIETICTGEVKVFKQTNDTLIINLIAKTGNHILTLSCKKLTTVSSDTLIFDESIDCTDSYKFIFEKDK